MKGKNNNFVNVSVLIAEYNDLCKEVVENSDARIRFWYEKRNATYGRGDSPLRSAAVTRHAKAAIMKPSW